MTKEIFNSIASKYDATNLVVSLFLYPLMLRTYTSALLKDPSFNTILDIGAGTGEMTFRLFQKAERKKIPLPHCTLLDFSENMLAVARKRKNGLPEHIQSKITIVEGDALHLPFENNFFDRTTASFLLRNVDDKEMCFSEALRVLKPNGKAYFFELSKPKNKCLLALYRFYLAQAVPPLGALCTGNREAFDYLNKSIMDFPDDETLSSFAKKAGSGSITILPIFGGIARTIIVEK